MNLYILIRSLLNISTLFLWATYREAGLIVMSYLLDHFLFCQDHHKPMA